MVQINIGKMEAVKEQICGFMWLDLRQSTHWLRALGTAAYAHLLQKCWDKLANCLDLNKSFGLYQYVGDAAIVVWDDLAQSEAAIALYQMFQAALQADVHTQQCRFRATLHAGETVRIRRGETDFYHGLVLHDLARLVNLHSQLIGNVLVTNMIDVKLSRYCANLLPSDLYPPLQLVEIS